MNCRITPWFFSLVFGAHGYFEAWGREEIVVFPQWGAWTHRHTNRLNDGKIQRENVNIVKYDLFQNLASLHQTSNFTEVNWVYGYVGSRQQNSSLGCGHKDTVQNKYQSEVKHLQNWNCHNADLKKQEDRNNNMMEPGGALGMNVSLTAVFIRTHLLSSPPALTTKRSPCVKRMLVTWAECPRKRLCLAWGHKFHVRHYIKCWGVEETW